MRSLLTLSPKKRSRAVLLAAASVALISGAVAPLSAAHAADKTSIKVGIMSGEDEDVWREVIKQAAAKGLTVKTVIFNDYNQPNEALQENRGRRQRLPASAFPQQPD
ncbi:MetQ/NlpA family ABC transporter substrate-binding protein [Rouxiella chamberiensis]|uniref:MetQ/NlpA family ABC transporter substrate-binding protein n=1 Tax=Rouxiella chamberiensis TaxID=1513468 RepID=A0ABY7HQS3_9GAMM|nr:MetQ/NlpA family ABC transporter substrate-binding protein [Rouxiella chamberiensis]WAT01747.1 MetQ/NlpA family ABC transporter substrate-binding protein [Rouxiella chamberiensis]